MKRIISIFLIAVLFLGFCYPILQAQSLTKIYVNGIKQDIYPYIKDGVAYLPANPLAMTLGINISWNASTRIIKVNNKVISSSPLELQGKLYLPVESICSASGSVVEWDGSANAIRITSSNSDAGKVEVADSSTSPTSVIAKTPVTVPTANTPTPKATATPKVSYIPTVKAPDPSVSYTPYNRTSASSTTTDTSISSGQGYTPKPPSVYSGQASRSAYPDEGVQRNEHLRPKDAPPDMPRNLSLPPISMQGKVSSPDQTYVHTSPFIPKSESNDAFRVTVTNIEFVNAIKDYYKPKPGYRFVIVYLSQQNISDQVQIYTGRFSMLDQGNSSYDYIEGLSNFWLVILRPGGINFGYLVFEIPADTKPMNLVLHGLNRAPLLVALR